MAENVTTVNNLPEAGDISGEDLIYLVQGSGSDRDRKATLAAIKAYIDANLGDIAGKSLTLNYQDSQAGQVWLKIEPYATQSVKGYRVTASHSALTLAKATIEELTAAGLTVTGDAEISGDLTASGISTDTVTAAESVTVKANEDTRIATTIAPGEISQTNGNATTKLESGKLSVGESEGGSTEIDGGTVTASERVVTDEIKSDGDLYLSHQEGGKVIVTGTSSGSSSTPIGAFETDELTVNGKATAGEFDTGKATLGGFFKQVAIVGILMEDDVAQTRTVLSNAYVPPGYALQVTIPHALTFESDEPQISATDAVITATVTLGDSETGWKISIPDFAKAKESVVIHLSQTFAVRNESATKQTASVSFALSGTIGHTGSITVTDGGPVIFDCHAI